MPEKNDAGELSLQASKRCDNMFGVVFCTVSPQRRVTMVSENLSAHGMRRPRDDNDELPSIQKPGDGNQTLLILMAVGGIGLVLIGCLAVAGVGYFLAFNNSTQAKLAGAWKGRWTVHGQQMDSLYTFRRDGSFREESFNMQGIRLNIADGRWHLRNGEIEIDWDNGGFENATARWIDNNTIEYRIVEHNDMGQIGLTTTFRRQ